jgi:hypothetical protein
MRGIGVRGRWPTMRVAVALCIGVAGCGSTPAGSSSRPAAVAHTLSVHVAGSGRVTGFEISCPPLCTQEYPRPARVLVGFGQSVEAGYGATNAAMRGWMGLLAARLRMPQENYAVSGSAAAYPDGEKHPGGWALVLQSVKPGTDLGAPPESIDYTMMYGLNDVAFLGGPDKLGPFVQAMITMISRIESVAVREDNDPSVHVPSGWTSYPTAGLANSGKTILAPRSFNNPITIKVPANFQGGTISLGFTVGTTSATPRGRVVYRLRVDAGRASRYVINGSTMVPTLLYDSGGYIGTVDRVNGLTPGAHTIKVALEATSNALTSYFDYWEAEAPPATARPLVVPLQYETTSAGYANYHGYPYVPDDAGVQIMNRTIERIVAQFGPEVRTVPFDLGKKLVNLASDQLHPSDAGYFAIFKQALAAFESATLSAEPSRGYLFSGWGGSCSGAGTCTVGMNSDKTITATFRRDP